MQVLRLRRRMTTIFAKDHNNFGGIGLLELFQRILSSSVQMAVAKVTAKRSLGSCHVFVMAKAAGVRRASMAAGVNL
jgi:hypothetical protein